MILAIFLSVLIFTSCSQGNSSPELLPAPLNYSQTKEEVSAVTKVKTIESLRSIDYKQSSKKMFNPYFLVIPMRIKFFNERGDYSSVESLEKYKNKVYPLSNEEEELVNFDKIIKLNFKLFDENFFLVKLVGGKFEIISKLNLEPLNVSDNEYRLRIMNKEKGLYFIYSPSVYVNDFSKALPDFLIDIESSEFYDLDAALKVKGETILKSLLPLSSNLAQKEKIILCNNSVLRFNVSGNVFYQEPVVLDEIFEAPKKDSFGNVKYIDRHPYKRREISEEKKRMLNITDIIKGIVIDREDKQSISLNISQISNNEIKIYSLDLVNCPVVEIAINSKINERTIETGVFEFRGEPANGPFAAVGGDILWTKKANVSLVDRLEIFTQQVEIL
ncbi:hypothetical protein M899_2918 [Bacteriovorax sp. BSW11_IV]|uniref:hypothetical protein n=1 Tax=Bacteriovorax sp. BSW11_IV TaxID=1353529 RepID=UPI000389FD9C|nr:hypothetical protein [Bacteriovorax sp. BSW11_IV]EQC50163.1 hypothetical protein M899_2918 [Bacteriovorax sp. BSW11_IV]